MLDVSPVSVRGSQTGVFVGCMAADAYEAWSANADKVSGYETINGARSMLANRLSYFFDFNGLTTF